MKISANFATYPPRADALKKAVASIIDQVDEVRIHFNEFTIQQIPLHFQNMDKVYCTCGENYTDNAKFLPLDTIFNSDKANQFTKQYPPEYYFSCDDDIIYPPDYVEKTIDNIKGYGMIISYHGRILQGLDRNYYRGHKAFKCLDPQDKDVMIDVCGTGVTAFDTRYFHPKGLATNPNQKMSDIIFSLEASKQGKKIGCCSRPSGWIRAIMHEENIYDSETKGGIEKQNELANEIFKLNHE